LGPKHDRPLLTRIERRELDHQVAVRQERLDGVAPLDEQHAVLGGLFELEFEDVPDAFEPVDVGVDDGQAGRPVLADQGERRRHDVTLEPQPAREPLGERGLARTELARERDRVAGRQQRRDGPADRTGLLGRRRAELEIHQNRPSCSSAGSGRSASAARISWKSARSAVIWFEAWPPPWSTAAGWNVGMTVRPFQGNRWPRTRLIETCRPRMYRVAQFPSVTTTAGSMIAIRSSSHGLHASSSSGSGSRFPGGRQL